VATEYIEPSTAIRNFKSASIKSLSERARLVIDGFDYEEDLTSGGAADLPTFFAGRAKNLDYKTLRHIGHYEWIDGLLKTLPESNEKPDLLQAIMKETIPRVEDDFVLIYASVQGKGKGGEFLIKEKVYYVEPIEIGGKHLRAIQATTASALAECASMLLQGSCDPGVVLQSEIDPGPFLKGAFVSAVYGSKAKGA
jgi:saccharopine dehydrogenase-like NADP-dependent oxidoreductase